MIYIKKAVIENFQSHENSILEFSDGLNVIVGPSDQGKSAIIRAIKWVLFNEPKGTDFIRHGASYARVSLSFSNGLTVVRERSRTKNRYVLIDEKGNESIFEGFGNEIPQEITDAHGISKVMLDSDIGSDLNISDQLEGPFLLSESGAVRAKALGRLTGLHVIDKAMRDTIADLRRESQSKDKTEKEIELLDKELEQYKNLDEIKQIIDDNERIIGELESKINKSERLIELKDKNILIAAEYDKNVAFLQKLAGIEEAVKLTEDADKILEKINRLTKIKQTLETCSEKINESRIVLEQTKDIDVCREYITDLQRKREKYILLSNINESMRNITKEIEICELKLKSTENLKEIEILINQAEIKSMNAAKIEDISKRYESLDKDIKKVEKFIELSAKTQECENLLEDIRQKKMLLEKLADVKARLSSVEESIGKGRNVVQNNETEIKKLAKEYEKVLKGAGRCPLCGSFIDEHKVNDILKHYEEVH